MCVSGGIQFFLPPDTPNISPGLTRCVCLVAYSFSCHQTLPIFHQVSPDVCVWWHTVFLATRHSQYFTRSHQMFVSGGIQFFLPPDTPNISPGLTRCVCLVAYSFSCHQTLPIFQQVSPDVCVWWHTVFLANRHFEIHQFFTHGL